MCRWSTLTPTSKWVKTVFDHSFSNFVFNFPFVVNFIKILNITANTLLLNVIFNFILCPIGKIVKNKLNHLIKEEDCKIAYVTLVGLN